MSEVKAIMDFLGRKQIEGEVRGSHLGQILTYLEQYKTESLKSTLSKLALICGMNKRYVRENYLEGLTEFGVIQIYQIKNDVFWKWIGIKAFNGLDESFMDYAERRKQEKEEKENNKK